jgi:hypothetical protein
MSSLIDESVKKNLANNLVANYDENGDGLNINGQPLQVNSVGSLIVSVVDSVTIGGQVYTILLGTNTSDGSTVSVKTDNSGALNVGGMNTDHIRDSFQKSGTYTTFANATNAIPVLREQLLSDVTGHNYTRIYNYAENVFAQGSSFYVVVSCWGSN